LETDMTARTELNLTLDVEGTSNEELMRGLRAAIALFDKAGVSAVEAAHAAFKREGWDVAGFDPSAKPSAEEMKAAALWDNAEEAAIEACCAGWPALPVGATLSLSARGANARGPLIPLPFSRIAAARRSRDSPPAIAPARSR
jgi:hypothetical protein